MPVEKLKKCPTCHGHGRCNDGSECPTCEGKGEVPTDQPAEAPCR